MPTARAHLDGLVGTEIHTFTEGRLNRILRIEGDDVVVGTGKSAGGRRVPIRWLQDGIDLLAREGEITVGVATLGHRSAFVDAFLAMPPGVVMLATRPRRLALRG